MGSSVESIHPAPLADFGPQLASAVHDMAQELVSWAPAPLRAPRIKAVAKPRVLDTVETTRPATAHAPLLAVVFRPDGGKALTLRIGALHCIGVALVLTGALGAALAMGWMLGEWTARL